MKKNKILYLIFTIIILFSCSNKVNAAQELTCLYKRNFDVNVYTVESNSLLLIQYADGNREIYVNKDDKKIEDNGWTILSNQAFFNDSSLNYIKDNDGNLTQCPENRGRDENNNVIFYEKNFGGTIEIKAKSKLKEELKEIKKPIVRETETNLGINKGNSCPQITSSKWIEEYNEDKYQASCLYERDVAEGCHIIQINIKRNGDFIIQQNDPKENLGPNGQAILEINKEDFIKETIADIYSGECPSGIYVKRTIDYPSRGNNTPLQESGTLTSSVSTSKDNNSELYTQVDGGAKGYNLQDGITPLKPNADIDLNFDIIKITSCEQMFGENSELTKMLKGLISMVKIIIPLILIALGSVDFAKAIFAGKEDEMKKAQSKFIKRLIIGVVIFLIPSVLKLLLTIGYDIWGIIDPTLCGLI